MKVVASPTDAIRTARLQLAIALRDLRPDDPEVLTQLQHALDLGGSRPPNSVILHEIGNTLLRRNDRPGAFAAFLRAVASDPHSAEPAAQAAIRLMTEGADDSSLVAAVSDEDAGSFDSAIRHSDDWPDSVCLLAAELHIARGEAARAIELLEKHLKGGRRSSELVTELARALIAEGRPEEALGYLERLPTRRSSEKTLLEATALVDSGQFDRARMVAGSITDGEPAAQSVKALALFGLGQAEDGLNWVSSDSSSRDGALTDAILRLHLASQKGSDGDTSLVNAANDSAVTALRLEPSNPDALLVRAQVLLEGSLDVDEGRRLLANAASTRANVLGHSRWLRIQERVRADNSWFRYFQVELALADHDEKRVLKLVDGVDRGGTTYAQDATLATLVADIHERRREIPVAANAYADAAVAYGQVNDRTRALNAARKAMSLESTPQRVLSYVDALWQWTHEAIEIDQVEASVSDALKLIDELGDDLTIDLAETAALLRGLLLYRRAEISAAERVPRSWQAVPWLLLAMALNPAEPYTPGHIAWALERARAPRAALFFAERAYHIGPTYPSLQECLLAMRFNYFGRLDPETERLAQDYTAEIRWRDNLLLVAALMDGKLPPLADRTAERDSDPLWALEAVARIRVLKEGVEAARHDLDTARRVAVQRPQSWSIAVDFALLLGEPTRAQEALAEAEASGDLGEDALAWTTAILALVTTTAAEGAEARLADIIKKEDVPYTLRSMIYADLPVFKRMPGSPPTVAAAIDRMIAAARVRLADLESHGLPPVQDDLAEADDPEVLELVLQLFDIVQKVDTGSGAEAVLVAAQLAEKHRGGTMGAAFANLRTKLETDAAAKPA